MKSGRRHPPLSPADLKELMAAGRELIEIWAGREPIKPLLNYLNELLARGGDFYRNLDIFGMDPKLIDSLRPLFQFLYQDWWRVETEGVKNIPPRSGTIIVANHSGTLPYDGPMLNLAVHNKHPQKRNVRFLVDDFVSDIPYLGLLINRLGGVSASPENAQRLLKKGELIAIFPEGVKGIGKLYKDRYKLARFGRGGVIRLALQTGAPIIPTAIIGAEDIHPMLAKITSLAQPLNLPYIPITPTFPWLGPLGLIPFPSQWKIIFDKPFKLDKTKGRSERYIQMMNNKLRKRVAELIRQHLAR